MDKTLIDQIVEENAYKWTHQKHEYALVRIKNRYQSYHVPSQEIGDTEIEEANKIIWANMINAGVTVLDEFPNQITGYRMAIFYRIRKRLNLFT